jgi:1-acyl-sn-glycerol-3-phosphate acyltransferase
MPARRQPNATPVPKGYSARVYGFSKWLLRVWARVWLRLRIEGMSNAPKTGAVLVVYIHVPTRY